MGISVFIRKGIEILAGTWKKDRPEHLASTLKSVEERVSYNALLKSCANAFPARPENAEQIIKLMQTRGVMPNVVSYNSLMKAYVNASHDNPNTVHLVEEVLHRMQTSGPSCHDSPRHLRLLRTLYRHSHGALRRQVAVLVVASPDHDCSCYAGRQ